MAGWSDWINLELDDDDRLDMSMPIEMDAPAHPPGMRICLSGIELRKANLPMPDRGDMLDMRVFGEVMNISDGAGGQRVEIQIVALKLEDEDRESE